MNLYASSSEERLTLGQAGNRHCLAPQGLAAHSSTQFLHVFRDRLSARLAVADFPSPEQPEALAVPGNDGFRLDRELISLLRNSHTSSLIRSTSSLLVKYAKLCAGVC